MSTLSQLTLQRTPTPQHLNSHSNTVFVSYASSIASSPSSRTSSPAPPSSSVPTPPDSPVSPFQHQKGYGSSPPSSISTSFHNSATVSINSGAPSPDFTASTASPIHSLISLLFLQPTTRFVLALTILLTLSSIWGTFPDHCSAPSHVFYTGRIAAMLASPFVVPLTPTLLTGAHQTLGTSILLGASNFISLALFEERLTSVFNGNGAKVFRTVLLTIFALVLTIRQLLGINFSRAFGWQIPTLFFSDSMLECNLGLSPFLFSLLVVQALFPEKTSPSIADYGSSTGSRFVIRRIYLQTVLCLFNVIPKTIVWWAISGLLGGFMVALVVSYQRRMGRWGGKVKTSTVEKHFWESTELMDDNDEGDYRLQAMTKEHIRYSSESSQGFFYESGSIGISGASREKKLSVTLWKTVSYVMPLITVLVLVLIGCNKIHTFRPDVSNELLNTTIEPATPFLLTLVIMTAPRRNNVAYIKQTLWSYLASFPDEVADPLYSRIQIVVYTHFTDFAAFDEAKEYFQTIPKARKHVKWIRHEGFEKNQRKHLISAIRKVGSVEDTVYLGIMEDDFPFCEGGWQEMLNTIYLAHQTVPEHCGVFIATGGSGLLFKRSVALTASFILEGDMHAEERGERATPPDISLQNCILGKHDYCSSCEGTLMVSKTLLQGHLGYNSSTSGDGYQASQFQCGWRHPFNGWPSVHTA